jgi:hypothetical protein
MLNLAVAISLIGFSVPLLLMWLSDWEDRRTFDDADD